MDTMLWLVSQTNEGKAALRIETLKIPFNQRVQAWRVFADSFFPDKKLKRTLNTLIDRAAKARDDRDVVLHGLPMGMKDKRTKSLLHKFGKLAGIKRTMISDPNKIHQIADEIHAVTIDLHAFLLTHFFGIPATSSSCKSSRPK